MTYFLYIYIAIMRTYMHAVLNLLLYVHTSTSAPNNVIIQLQLYVIKIKCIKLYAEQMLA